MLYSLQDITLIPAVISNVNSRRECNPHDYFEMLPLFAAPMSSVIDDKNWKTFHDNKINTIIPRNVRLSEAPSHSLPICKYDPTCIGAKSYEKLAEEVIRRG
jgi:cellulose biosynthesis protein BcsQ